MRLHAFPWDNPVRGQWVKNPNMNICGSLLQTQEYREDLLLKVLKGHWGNLMQEVQPGKGIQSALGAADLLKKVGRER